MKEDKNKTTYTIKWWIQQIHTKYHYKHLNFVFCIVSKMYYFIQFKTCNYTQVLSHYDWLGLVGLSSSIKWLCISYTLYRLRYRDWILFFLLFYSFVSVSLHSLYFQQTFTGMMRYEHRARYENAIEAYTYTPIRIYMRFLLNNLCACKM